MEQDKPKYVIDSVIGGVASYNAVVGLGAPESSAPHERVWPEIPLEYRPPPPEIENTVKEGMYVIGYEFLVLTINSWIHLGLS
jgi:hypothetical protein